MKKFTSALLMILFFSTVSFSQSITTQAGNNIVCANDFTTPVTVVKCEDVGAISLTLMYDPAVLTFVNIQNEHPALSIGNLVVNDIGGIVKISWYTVGSIPLNILFGSLLDINWTSAGGYSPLTWDLSDPIFCEYADLNAVVLPATFVDGDVTINPLPAITADPVDVTVDEGQTALFSVTGINATNYTWEVSEDGGANWTTVGTGSTLSVIGTTLAMDGNMYRCIAAGICTPDAVSNFATLHINPIITTILGSYMDCEGDVIIPINVEHFYTVASLSYTFGYNTLALSYVGVQDVHGDLASGTFYANEISPGIIRISWASLTPADIGDDLLLNLVFTSNNAGTSNLIWALQNPDDTQYTNIGSDIITAIWINGTVTIFGLPTAYNVTGGGEFCEFGQGVEVGLSGSQADVMYGLLVNGAPLGAPIQGTGWALSFGMVPTAGTFTVNAENMNTLCFNDMIGSVDISINPNPSVDAGADVSILTGTTTTLYGAVAGGTPGYIYEWLPGGETTEDITVGPVANTTYTFIATDSKGCWAEEDVNVSVYTNILSGHINYDNVASTDMNNVAVDLVTVPGAFVVQSTVTDLMGHFEFGPQENGDYQVVSSCAKPWGGVNSTDALLIMEHFVGSIPLSGIRLIAADVNASGFVNAGDALFAAQRFAYVITSFPAGDWAFENSMVTLNEADIHIDELALCFGDVNGSFTPSAVKITPSMTLTNNGIVEVTGQVFELDVTVNTYMEIGAVSLIIDIPDNVEVVDIKGLSDVIYTIVDGKLRISWFNTAPVYLNADETLVTLTLKADDIENVSLSLDASSELADGNANVIYEASVNMAKIAPAGTIAKGNSINNYPNPFNSNTTFEYTIAKAGNVNISVYNILGEKIQNLVNKYQNSGSYKFNFDGSNLNDGTYFYKIVTSDFVKTKTMVINK
ncbi:MAG: T9SS type A sorting domain-containing protein [Bacteroidales bacterium]|nr:T9SS type A sorting domain-containing protein [Bacteroidales bacterium]